MAKKNSTQEAYSSKGGTTITFTIKDQQGNPINGVAIKKPTTPDVLGTTNSTGVATIQAAAGDKLLLEKMGYVPKELTLTQETTVAQTLSRQTLVFVVDREGYPLEGMDVIAFNEAGTPYEKSAEEVLENGLSIGKYAFHEAIAANGSVEVSRAGYLRQRKNINGDHSLSFLVLTDTPENRSLPKVQNEYEQISGLITGNSPDNDTVDQKCLIKIPDINRKIKQRLNQ